MRTHRFAAVAAALLLLAGAHAAHAMAGFYGKGDPKRPVSCSSWPAGVAALANRTDRIGGHWVNASDWFDYAGDAKAFNDFLARYADVPGASLILGDPVAVLTNPTGAAVSPGYDWQMSVTGWGGATVCVTLPLGGTIRLRDVRVPAGVALDSVGPKSPELEELLADHAARRAKRLGEKPSAAPVPKL